MQGVILLCVSFDIDEFRWAQTMVYTITEINSNPSLLPNVTLGYILYDTCYTTGIGFRAALSLVSGREERSQLDESCVGSPPVLGIVGNYYTPYIIAMSSVLGLYRVPLVSCLLGPYFYHHLLMMMQFVFLDFEGYPDDNPIFKLKVHHNATHFCYFFFCI